LSTLQQAIEALQDMAGGLSGIRDAPDYAPEEQSAFPFAVAYHSSSDWDALAASSKTCYATIVVEIHCSRAPGLPRAIEEAMPYHESFPNAVLGDIQFTAAGLSSTYVTSRVGPPIRCTFGALNWGDVETVGYRFEVDIKQVSSIS